VQRLLASLLFFPCLALANFTGNNLFWASRFSELEAHMERAVPDLSKGETSDLFYLCAAYFELKKYNRLFPCLDQWEKNAASGDLGGFTTGGDATHWMHRYRAEATIELGDYPKAIEHAAKSYRYVLDKRMRAANGIYPLAALSLAYALAGDRAKAEEHARLLDALHDTMNVNIAPRLVGLSKTYLALGDHKKCLDTMSQETSRRSLLATIGLGIGSAMGVTAFTDLPKHFIRTKCALEAGEREEAKKGYDELLAYPQLRSLGTLYWIAHFDRGRIAEAEGNRKEAIGLYRSAIEAIEAQRSTINTEASKIGFAGDKQAVYRALVAALFAEHRHGEAFEFVERSKARALVDLLADKRDFAVASNPDAVRRLLESARTAETDAVAYSGKPAPRNLAITGVKQALEQQAPELASLVSVSPTPIAEIQSRIPEDEALVEYYYDDKAVYAFLLTRAGLQGRKLDAAGLEADIRALRQAIETPTNDSYQEPARRLHARLIAPLGITSRKLLIVAHGALHYMPFGALHDGKAFLLETHSLRFLPSASVLRYLRTPQPGQRAGVLAFGNPDLGDPRFDLKFAQDEALAIAQKVPQSRALLRKEASVSAFGQFAGGFSTLHFATHGEFNGDTPLQSALLLSDGSLTVNRLYSTRIAADLVTLSACETGLGKVASGDDVVGLTRGFLYAGASTVVASLWKVDDQATAALMTRFYDELKGGDKREALRKAQLAAREKFPHPFFWAAFQLTGRAD
jgi:CHAT domain-containing protein